MRFSIKKGSLILIKSLSNLVTSTIYLDEGDEFIFSDMYSTNGVNFSKIDNDKKQRLDFNALVDSYFYFTIVDILKGFPYSAKFNLTANFNDSSVTLFQILSIKNSKNKTLIPNIIKIKTCRFLI